MLYVLSHFSFSYKTRSFLLFFLLFLVDSILREFVGEQVHKYVLSLYILGFFFYYRFGLGQGNALLNAALVFQFVGIFLATYVTKNVWFFSIMMIVLNLNIVLFSSMLYKCAKIKKVSLYLIGFLLTLPYGIVMNFKISDYYGALFWGVQLRMVVLALLVSVSVVQLIKFPSVKGSLALIGAVLIFTNNIFSGYNLFYFGEAYFKYAITLTYLLGYFFILTFFIEHYDIKKEDVLYKKN